MSRGISHTCKGNKHTLIIAWKLLLLEIVNPLACAMHTYSHPITMEFDMYIGLHYPHRADFILQAIWLHVFVLVTCTGTVKLM